MKKLFIALFLTLGIILISGCSFNEQKSVDNSVAKEQTSILPQQISSGIDSQIETLKTENEKLKEDNQNLKTTIKQEANKNEMIEEANLVDNKFFNTSDIEFIVDEKNMESYFIHKTVKQYEEGYIGIKIGGQDGVSSDILYIKNGKIIKEMENVFWYDYYNDNNIHEYCNGDLRDCKITKKTQCKINHEKNIECINSFFEYVYKLINNTEKNDYFSEKFNGFIKLL